MKVIKPEETLVEIREIVRHISPAVVPHLTMDTEFIHSNLMDSLEFIHMISQVEDHFKIRIHSRNVGEIKTVKDLVFLILKKTYNGNITT